MDSRATETYSSPNSSGPFGIRPLEPGSVIAGRYEVRRHLGMGGSGIAYAVFDRTLRTEVALKLLRPDRFGDTAVRRFRREVQAARESESPNLVRVYDIGESGGLVFLTMELMEGESLRAKLSKGLSREEALRLGSQVLRGLSALHAVGIVHRDVKPGNVFLDAGGDAKLGDFGLARWMDSDESPRGLSRQGQDASRRHRPRRLRTREEGRGVRGRIPG